MNSISELVARAVEMGDWDELVPNDNYVKDHVGFTIPKDGFVGPVTAKSVTFAKTSKDNPYIGIQCETEDNIFFWTNVYFSDNDSSNLITMKNLEAWGVTKEFLAENPNDDDAIAEQITGSNPIQVRIRHQEGDDDRIFLRPTFSPLTQKDDSTDEDEEWVFSEDQ